MTGIFKPRNTERARELRNQATPAERTLWRALNRSQIRGHKFSRQMPVGPYFADFLCREQMLVIEVDGYSHDMRTEQDLQRDRFMADHGYRVMRISNRDVMTNLDGVVRLIAQALDETDPPPTPPASGRGEENEHASA